MFLENPASRTPTPSASSWSTCPPARCRSINLLADRSRPRAARAAPPTCSDAVRRGPSGLAGPFGIVEPRAVLAEQGTNRTTCTTEVSTSTGRSPRAAPGRGCRGRRGARGGGHGRPRWTLHPMIEMPSRDDDPGGDAPVAPGRAVQLAAGSAAPAARGWSAARCGIEHDCARPEGVAARSSWPASPPRDRHRRPRLRRT